MRRIDTSRRATCFVRAMRLPDVCWKGSHGVGSCFRKLSLFGFSLPIDSSKCHSVRILFDADHPVTCSRPVAGSDVSEMANSQHQSVPRHRRSRCSCQESSRQSIIIGHRGLNGLRYATTLIQLPQADAGRTFNGRLVHGVYARREFLQFERRDGGPFYGGGLSR
jgi:hypothetical protein